MNFKDLIENKKIAIVGPAEYMMDSGFGDQIDDHDFVVRLNRGIELTKNHSQDVGKKSDILYSCLIEKPANAGSIDPNELADFYNVKYLCAPPESSYQGIATKTKFHHMVNLSKVQKIKERMPVRIVDHEFHTMLAKKVDCRPNTGFLAIYDLLRFNPNKLSIYGFSFYLDGFFHGCKDGVQGEQNLTEKQFAERCFNSTRHVQKNMWQLAKNTLLGNKKVFLDPVLTDILNLERLDKNLFIEKRQT